MAGRAVLAKLPSICFFSRSFASRALPLPLARSSPLLHLRPLVAAASAIAEFRFGSASASGLRCFSTRPTTSSLNDPSPNWSNRPPKETILLDGCDFEHWLVVMDPPDPSWTRDEIIDSYIKTLAQVLGSEEEARMSIYSVSTKHYFAFGCKVSEEMSYKIKPLAKVRWVLPDSYLDVKNKDYGGEPFIDGQAVPYDPKYHEEWVRNNARAQDRSRRTDRPRNFDRSRNFERRRENMQNFQSREAPPGPNQGFQNSMPPRDVPPPSNPPPNYQNQMPNQQNYMPQTPGAGAGYQGSNQAYQGGPGYQGAQGYQAGGAHPAGGMPGGPAQGGGHPAGGMPGGPAQGGGHPAGSMPGGPAQGGQGYQGVGGVSRGNMPGGPPYQGPNPGNYQSGGPANQGGGPSYQGHNPGYQGNSQPYQGGGFSGYQPSNSGYQGGPPNYQQGAPSYQGGGASPYPGRDVPGRD